MTIRISLFALLLAFSASASAQTLLPARQVSVSTNAWTNLVPSAATLQPTLDWIDANWMRIDASAWTAIPTNPATAQEALDWIDGNWDSVSTNSWTFISPAAATGQASLDFLDSWFSSSGAANGFLVGTNIANAVWNPTSKTWEGLGNMPGTNLVGATYSNGQWYVDAAALGAPGVGTNYFIAYDGTADPQAPVVLEQVSYSVELYDGNGLFANNKFTPKTPGTYLVSGSMEVGLQSTPINARVSLYLVSTNDTGWHANSMYDREGDAIVSRESLSFTHVLYHTNASDSYFVARSLDGGIYTTNLTRWFSAMLVSTNVSD